MSFILADRVKETSTSIGSGTFSLAGAVTGYRAFGSVMSSGDTCYYTIAHQTVDEWEVGYGTYSGGSLDRNNIISSSSGGGTVSFSSGTKDVFITLPATGAFSNMAFGSNMSYPGGSYSDMTLFGVGSQGSGNGATAIGKSTAAVQFATSLGYASSANGDSTTAIGGATAGYYKGIAIGNSSISNADYAISIGASSSASATDAIGIGQGANAYAASAIAIGVSATSANSSNVAVGGSATANGTNVVVIGGSASASYSDSVSVGPSATVAGADGTSVGAYANAGQGGVAFGKYAATGLNGVSVGANSNASGASGATAVGANAYATYDGAIAIGSGANSNSGTNIVIGSSSQANGADNVLVGSSISSTSSYNSQVLVGSGASSASNETVAVGKNAAQSGQGVSIGYTANSNYASVAIGHNTQATATNAVAIGTNATANTTYSVAIGYNAGGGASSSYDYNTVVGSNASALGNQSVILGYNSYGGASSVAVGAYVSSINSEFVAVSTSPINVSNQSILLGRNSATYVPTSVVVGYMSTDYSTGSTGNIVIGPNITAAADGATYMNRFRTGVTPVGTSWYLKWDDSTKEVYADAGPAPAGATWYTYQDNDGTPNNLDLAVPSGAPSSGPGFNTTYLFGGMSPSNPSWSYQGNPGGGVNNVYSTSTYPITAPISGGPYFGAAVCYYTGPEADTGSTSAINVATGTSPYSSSGSNLYTYSGFPVFGSSRTGHYIAIVGGNWVGGYAAAPGCTLSDEFYDSNNNYTFFFIDLDATAVSNLSSGLSAGGWSGFASYQSFFWYTYA